MSQNQLITIFGTIVIALLTGAFFIVKSVVDDVLKIVKEFPGILKLIEEIRETLKDMPSRDFIARVEEALDRLEKHNDEITELKIRGKDMKDLLDKYHDRIRALESEINLVNPMLDSEMKISKNTDLIVKGLGARLDKLETFLSGEDRRKT